MIRNALAALALTALSAAGCARPTEVTGTGPASATGTNVAVPTSTGRVPSGTTVWASLDHRIDNHTRVGDRFTATVTQDVVSPSGDLLIPRGARVVGTVVELHASPQYNEPAMVRLAVDRIQMAGVSQPVNGNIVQTEVPGRIRPSGRAIGVGAAGGALLGGILGGSWGWALGGAAIGAATGTAVSLGMSQSAELPAGTGLAIQLQGSVHSYAIIRGGRRAY